MFGLLCVNGNDVQNESSIDGAQAEGYKCIPTGREFEFPWECRAHCDSYQAKADASLDGSGEESDEKGASCL